MKPALLLLPGMLNDERIWAGVRAALVDGAGNDVAQVLVGDLCQDTSIEAIAERAWAQLDGVAPEQGLVIAGFSMGGYVALQMLARPRRRVDALALIATSARPESPEGAAVREKTIAAIGRDFAKVVDGILGFGTHPRFQADAAARAALREQMLGVGAEVAVQQNRAIMARADQRATARALDLRCTVLVGSDDRITPPELAEELAALIPRARLQRLPECGHMAPVEQPAALAAALRALCAAHED